MKIKLTDKIKTKVKHRKRLKYVKFPRPKFANVLGLVVLVSMVVFGLIIIRNVNKEFAVRQVAGKFQEFRYATLSFNNIYSGLPGDITNGSFYWKDTIDGNGDKKIDISSDETINAWKQLQNAKLINVEEVLSGKWDNGQGIMVPGINIPKVKDEVTGFYIGYDDKLETNVFGLGAAGTGQQGKLTMPALTPNEAYDIDLMIDDGIPDKGNLIVTRPDDSTDCYAAGEYKKETQVKECVLLFKL